MLVVAKICTFIVVKEDMLQTTHVKCQANFHSSIEQNNIVLQSQYYALAIKHNGMQVKCQARNLEKRRKWKCLHRYHLWIDRAIFSKIQRLPPCTTDTIAQQLPMKIALD